MSRNKRKTGIIGIGNLLCGDEGFGIHVIRYLEETYTFPDDVLLQDAGTAGIYLAPLLEQCDPLFVVDVVDIDAEPGSMHDYDMEDLKCGNIQSRMSPHQLGFLEIFQICTFRELAPSHVEFFCVVPKNLQTSINLSPLLATRVETVAEKILSRLAANGITVSKKQKGEHYA